MTTNPLSSLPCELAPGWREADVHMLQRLAELGMQMAERLASPEITDGEADPAAQAQVQAKLAQAFTNVARCVRFTLALKARACGAAGPAQPRPVEDPDDLNFDVDSSDPSALTHESLMARAAAEVRLAFHYVINDPANIGDFSDPPTILVERQRLREGLERFIEREREQEHFRRGPDMDMLQRICRDLGLPFLPTLLHDRKGVPQAWIIARENEPQSSDGVYSARADLHFDEFYRPFRLPPREPHPPP
jgi:hypothetical protein